MADTTTNPIHLTNSDEGDTIFEHGKPYVLRKISYTAGADDQDVVLSDSLGNEVWRCKAGDASTEGAPWTTTQALEYNGNRGLVATTIDGGNLYLYV